MNKLDVEDSECVTKKSYELDEVSNFNGDENVESYEEEYASEDICMTTYDSEYKNKEYGSLIMEEILALLDTKYKKHVERNSSIFFSIHHDEQVDKLVYAQEDHNEDSDL